MLCSAPGDEGGAAAALKDLYLSVLFGGVAHAMPESAPEPVLEKKSACVPVYLPSYLSIHLSLILSVG